ncbi:MAG: 2-hydroxychromene-2-carboxylate isomerase [Pseudomonadota bacterium]
MTKTVEMLFDFVSPNAYLAWYPLQDILARTGAALTITPAFLGGIMKLTGNQPPMVANAGIKGKNEYMMLEMQRFIAKHGLAQFAMNPHFPMMTITIQRMLQQAVDEGRGAAFIDHVLPHVWERGVDISNHDAILAVLDGSEFDGAALLAGAAAADVKARLTTNTETAVARGVFGLPTFFVGDEIYFGKDRLDGVEEALTAR